MIEEAILAGGCFWCLEEKFSNITGVLEVIPGYSGGKIINPSYEQVITGKTGHREAVSIKFDNKLISFEEILNVFFDIIDPSDSTGQYSDRGEQYKTAIFYKNIKQKNLSLKLINKIKKQKKVFTIVKKLKNFYPAEEYHKQFYKKEPFKYEMYKRLSGRES